MVQAIIVKFDDGQLGFVRYTIMVTNESQSWTMVRRFKDFGPLHEALIQVYPSLKITPPTRKWFGRFNADFLKQRRAQLQSYLDAVTALPQLLNCPQARAFFEVDRQSAIEDSRAVNDINGDEDVASRGEGDQLRISAILEETTRALINTSAVPIDQIDPVELQQQKDKILQRTLGFRGQSQLVTQRMLFSRCLHTSSSKNSQSTPSLAIDLLAAPPRVLTSRQGQLLEKQGLALADHIREARQVRTITGDDPGELLCLNVLSRGHETRPDER